MSDIIQSFLALHCNFCLLSSLLLFNFCPWLYKHILIWTQMNRVSFLLADLCFFAPSFSYFQRNITIYFKSNEIISQAQNIYILALFLDHFFPVKIITYLNFIVVRLLLDARFDRKVKLDANKININLSWHFFFYQTWFLVLPCT